ncbi:MAG: DUF1810 domain-containing protein [Oscillatoria sp. PMC 1050.18]|nr:DUF1810 domain-containing protein [Oscillatoria sp. PMC 1050.18]
MIKIIKIFFVYRGVEIFTQFDNSAQELNMIPQNHTTSDDDQFNLNRFLKAQARVYDTVITELRNGRKRTHWMWYIFPQIDGLAQSATSKHYAIKSIQEAEAYLNHPLLGTRLLECTETVLAIEGRTISEIFGYPDDLKMKSSMTLFASITSPNSVFLRVLGKYFQGEKDLQTLQLFRETARRRKC